MWQALRTEAITEAGGVWAPNKSSEACRRSGPAVMAHLGGRGTGRGGHRERGGENGRDRRRRAGGNGDGTAVEAAGVWFFFERALAAMGRSTARPSTAHRTSAVCRPHHSP